MSGLDMTGLVAGAPQAWGAVRLVPLLRATPITDLRLHPRIGPSVYEQDGRCCCDAVYLPHAIVASWRTDGTSAATFGTHLVAPPPMTPTDDEEPRSVALRLPRRAATQADKQRVRFFPQQLAIEGLLALGVGGLPIAWAEWTHRAVTKGLTPREEAAYVGASIPGLDDALRVFEIHPDQCGMALYVADALAGMIVTPHPADYRALHRTLLLDSYGELIHHYATLFPPAVPMPVELNADAVDDIADLRAQVAAVRARWARWHDGTMASGLFDADVVIDEVRRLGRFTLSRFLPAFDPAVENHIGEMITDEAGRITYLRTMRLSTAQVKRGYLLSQLAANAWHLQTTATALGTDHKTLVERLERAGFGHYLRPGAVDHAVVQLP